MAELTKEELMEQLIDQLYEAVAKKEAAIEQAVKPNYLTGGGFRYTAGMSGQLDITTERDERKLVEVVAFLKERSKSYAEAAEELGCTVKFTWLNFTPDEWKADVQTRVNVLQIAKNKLEVAALRLRIDEVVPKNVRDARELAALKKALGL